MDGRIEHPIWPLLGEVEKRVIPFLSPLDICYYLLNRINGGYSASAANQRIQNFKHSLEKYHDKANVMFYKNREIGRFADDLSWHLSYTYGNASEFLDVALVPMNTSRPESDPYYDDRLVRLCEMAAARTDGAIRVANVMHTKERMLESHAGGTRSYDQLRDNLIFERFGYQVPDVAILVDDVLTTGAHYAACRNAIHETYGVGGKVHVEGAFLCIQRSRAINYEASGIEVTW